MTPEQLLAEAMLKSARADLARARLAWKASPITPEAIRLLAQAVLAEQDANKAYMAAMSTGLADEITGLADEIDDVVPDAFGE